MMAASFASELQVEGRCFQCIEVARFHSVAVKRFVALAADFGTQQERQVAKARWDAATTEMLVHLESHNIHVSGTHESFHHIEHQVGIRQ